MDLPELPLHWYSFIEPHEDIRYSDLNQLLKALVPQHAGVPEVRLLLQLDKGLRIHHAKRQRESKETKRKEDLRRAEAVGLYIEDGALSEDTLHEMARREALEPTMVKFLVVNTNEIVNTTVKGWQLIEASARSAMQGVKEVFFGGVKVDPEETFEDLGIENDATLSVVIDRTLAAMGVLWGMGAQSGYGGGPCTETHVYLINKTFETLPQEILCLPNLECLHLDDCSNLESLPEEIAQLTKLKTLCLECCRSLESLPHGIAQLTSLETLHLSGCNGLKTLPDISGMLPRLRIKADSASYSTQRWQSGGYRAFPVHWRFAHG